MERELANSLADAIRNGVELQLQEYQNMPENNEIINVIPDNINFNHNIPVNFINYIVNSDPLNPDDDQ